MNTLLSFKYMFLMMFYQTTPWEPPADGDTAIDAPIDHYIIVGLIVGMLMIIMFMYLQKTKTSKNISS